jgi:hypothetical protein
MLGGFDERRPVWGDFAPILLRGAGIVGAAGVIMAIVGGGAFFTGTSRAPSDKPATPTILHEETASAEQPVVAPVIAEASAPPTGRFSDVEPLAFVPPAPATTSAEPAAPRLASRADVEARDEPAAVPRLGSRADVEAGDETAAAPTLQAVDPARFEAVSPDPLAPSEEDSPWEEEAVACPRDWVADADANAADDGSANCGTETALAAADAVSPDLEAALGDAASEEAVEIIGFVARVPIPRPDPPPTPVRRTSNRPASWPDEPPPNCGGKHAYWHFVDRERKIKEWYCK